MNTASRPLNQDVIKYMAMLTMLLNHIGNIFLTPGTLLREVLISLGYFTAPVMVYFLVEGFFYTRSAKKYLLRMFLFGLASELPFCIAFTRNGLMSFVALNMLLTLTLCILELMVLTTPMPGWRSNLLLVLIFCASIFFDWAVFAPLMTLLFFRARGNRRALVRSFLVVLAVFWLFNMPSHSGVSALHTAAFAALDCVGMLLAELTLLYLYSGERGHLFPTFSKWFFYAFYPLHLLVLGLIRYFCL